MLEAEDNIFLYELFISLVFKILYILATYQFTMLKRNYYLCLSRCFLV
jgi:hypothetical protein